MRTIMLLALAALLEVGGDAIVRWGITSHRIVGLVLGAAVLFTYGVVVNTPRWDFGRLLGVYVAIFFVISQIIGVTMSHERLPLPNILGGVLIISGGMLMTFWKP
ncbi:hypothetical protein CCAX7_17710 [Capsulimonas corticalis]|uniref:Uncharacterized protein n=1 Tax=Capsulimonas corticalis TaxID=2219043 RepID=A0A402D3W9_9BACT|nr:hypothetical protein [Capsulimonas corticalis]BDI29720.1 hypothetical protein CCAX7_17710 [Capsulimonas corticalis]